MLASTGAVPDLARLAGLAPAEIAAARAAFPARIAPALPPAFAEMLAAAVAQERRDRSDREATLLRHYFEIMPAMRAAQLDPAHPQSTLFHTRLELARLPRLAAALDRLFALLERAGVPAGRALPAGSPAELVDRFPTLAELYRATYYGGFMPLLYGTPADLALFARDLGDPPAAIDRHLAAPIVHELCHLRPGRRALLPLYLDECVAGYLGVLVLPELAYPAPGESNGLYAAPWFSQVGQALARVAGLEPLVRAHAGVVPWGEVLPARFLEGALRLGWEDYLERRGPHFLSENFEPDPWLKLVYGAPGGTRAELAALAWRDLDVPAERDDDVEVIADALRAMCLDNYQVDRAFRVRTRLPDQPIRLDLEACRATVRGGPFDPPELAYHLPPAWARRVQAPLGNKEIHVILHPAGSIEASAAVLRTEGR